jgi:hypothetical protein
MLDDPIVQSTTEITVLAASRLVQFGRKPLAHFGRKGVVHFQP